MSTSNANRQYLSKLNCARCLLSSWRTKPARGAMDFGCITPLYLDRMWGGNVAIDETDFSISDSIGYE